MEIKTVWSEIEGGGGKGEDQWASGKCSHEERETNEMRR